MLDTEDVRETLHHRDGDTHCREDDEKPVTEEPGGKHTELPVLGPEGRRFHRNPPLRENVTVCQHRAIRTTLPYPRKGIGKNWSGMW